MRSEDRGNRSFQAVLGILGCGPRIPDFYGRHADLRDGGRSNSASLSRHPLQLSSASSRSSECWSAPRRRMCDVRRDSRISRSGNAAPCQECAGAYCLERPDLRSETARMSAFRNWPEVVARPSS